MIPSEAFDWWCTRCAAPAAYLGPGLDPSYTLGQCERVLADGRPRSCGQVPVVRSRQAARDAILVRMIDQQTAAHPRHVYDHPARWCIACQPARDHQLHLKRHRPDYGCDGCREVLARIAT